MGSPDRSIASVSDAELVERARGGDRDAFGELVERHQQAVFRTALAALRSREEAEEVAQDTFVTAMQKLDDFRGDASFKTWLLTIAWHKAIDRRRGAAEWFRRFVSRDRADAPEPVSPHPSHEQALIDAEGRGAVRRLVRKLPSEVPRRAAALGVGRAHVRRDRDDPRRPVRDRQVAGDGGTKAAARQVEAQGAGGWEPGEALTT